MTGSAAANTLWARGLMDELARAGVREVIVAPGSRSTPLVLAAAEDERLSTRVHLDERSAGFFALGVGKASRRPAAVITTSGTAVANLMPAVVEASQAGVPLLLLTADRPHRLRDADANQAIDQVNVFGGFTRLAFDLGLPSLDSRALRHVRTVAARAVAGSVAPDPGPVHVNVPFDKPLEPEEAPSTFTTEHPIACSGRSDGAPFVEIVTARPRLRDAQLEEVARLLASAAADAGADAGGVRGVIVAGPSEDADELGPAARRLAAKLGWPLLADPLSGGRYGPAAGAHVVAAYDLFMKSAAVREALRPDVILRVGTSPTSAALQQWMLHHADVTHVVIDDSARWKDHGASATHYGLADPTDAFLRLAEHVDGQGSTAWSERWPRRRSGARGGRRARRPSGGRARRRRLGGGRG
jgi:2-succinyl-5-enolpyruvyl-6-hydroxy-3-cyclohexene-1-carboxylate synthase